MRVKEKFVVIYKDRGLQIQLSEQPFSGEIFPAKDAEYAEFDTYQEAKAFVDEKGLEYKEPSYNNTTE